MEFLVYRKTTGKIQGVRNVAGVYDGAEVVRAIYGDAGAPLYDAMEWEGNYPIGKKVVNGAVVDDPDYVPPPVEPTPVTP